MADAVIENPVINAPFREPARHFRFGDEGITSEIVEGRRASSYFMPIPAARRRAQLVLDEWTRDRIEENRDINRLRELVGRWRQGGWRDVTPITRRLLEYWTAPDRERPLFFCQVEALETAIFIAEAAAKHGGAWVANQLRGHAEAHNPGLPRVAFKMATGAGKTVVMAMLIAWQTLNKLVRPQDGRFSDAFLVVTPGITIRDRLRVLLPSDPDSYYRQRDLVPPEEIERLGQAKIVITNFHAFLPRESGAASKTTKQILRGNRPGPSPFTETPDQVARRVCRELGTKRGLVVLNDEAHHCYRHKPDAGEDELRGDERREAAEREKAAHIWISGLEAVARKIGVKNVYDLSATPFFLRGSGYAEGTLFPWVVSDFSLIDAIESGIVKVPRVPVTDDSGVADSPTYRELWSRIRDDLPRRGRKDAVRDEEPKLPIELEGALQSLYGHYERSFRRWEERERAAPTGSTPPVFIVVCNNTSVSKLVFDYVAGWERSIPDGGTAVVPGKLSLFSNAREDARWHERPVTILVDSQQLESGESMSADFKRVAAHEIAEFKQEYRARYPGRDAEDLTDEDLLREVMNTVGKAGKLGERVRCVVSVSMLTEGWDANTVTHILGVRAFGTQLLCEQVVGRGLRRRSYVTNDQGLFEPEYAEVYGVPFSFIPGPGATTDPPPDKVMTRVRALESRLGREITFPRVIGYRYELGGEELQASFDDEGLAMALSTADVPTSTTITGIVGPAEIHTLDDLRSKREQEVAFYLAERVLAGYFPDRPWLFPQIVALARGWMAECVVLKDNTYVQLLLLRQHAEDAAGRIYRAIVAAEPGEKRPVAVPAPHDPTGSTRYVDFDTSKPVMATDPDRCHISHVVADSGWEHKLAETLEDMPAVGAYAKNHGLGFTIPYLIGGEDRRYQPDFLVRLDDARGADDPLNLVIEVSGALRRDKTEKVATARGLWVPGVNNLGAWGRWAFVEVTDPWDAKGVVGALLAAHAEEGVAA